MKFKMAVEMEFDVPDTHTKKFKGYTDEFYKDLAKAIADDTASNMAIVGIGVEYIDNCWLGEDNIDYPYGILYFRDW